MLSIGEALAGVMGAVLPLGSEEVALTAALGRVIVVGGGNTAIDVARECALLGAESVTMAYRRGVKDMSGYVHEWKAAKVEGARAVAPRYWYGR